MKPGGWSNPKVMAVALRLGGLGPTVGLLECVWRVASTDDPEGGTIKWASVRRLHGPTGPMADPAEALDVLVEEELVDRAGDALVVHGWDEHRPEYLAKRARERRRYEEKKAAKAGTSAGSPPASDQPPADPEGSAQTCADLRRPADSVCLSPPLPLPPAFPDSENTLAGSGGGRSTTGPPSPSQASQPRSLKLIQGEADAEGDQLLADLVATGTGLGLPPPRPLERRALSSSLDRRRIEDAVGIVEHVVARQLARADPVRSWGYLLEALEDPPAAFVRARQRQDVDLSGLVATLRELLPESLLETLDGARWPWISGLRSGINQTITLDGEDDARGATPTIARIHLSQGYVEDARRIAELLRERDGPSDDLQELEREIAAAWTADGHDHDAAAVAAGG